MKFLFKHSRRQQLVHEEVVCQRHRDEMAVAGGYMAPVSDKEAAAGIRMTFTPYDGPRPCACCEEAAEQSGAVA